MGRSACIKATEGACKPEIKQCRQGDTAEGDKMVGSKSVDGKIIRHASGGH